MCVCAHAQELLEFACVVPLRTVYSTLEARGGLKLLDDPLLPTATAEIVAGGGLLAWVLREVCGGGGVSAVLSVRRRSSPTSPPGFQDTRCIRQAQSRPTVEKVIKTGGSDVPSSDVDLCRAMVVPSLPFFERASLGGDKQFFHQAPVGSNSQAAAAWQGERCRNSRPWFQSRARSQEPHPPLPCQPPPAKCSAMTWQPGLDTAHAQSSGPSVTINLVGVWSLVS